MRTIGRRWLAPLAAVLVLLGGAVPNGAAAAMAAGSAAATSGAGHRAPDDAVHNARSEQGERGAVAERPLADGVLPSIVIVPAAPSTAAAGRTARTAVDPCAASAQPRAPPATAASVPS